jgi:hypothetical protein
LKLSLNEALFFGDWQLGVRVPRSFQFESAIRQVPAWGSKRGGDFDRYGKL